MVLEVFLYSVVEKFLKKNYSYEEKINSNFKILNV